MSASASAESGPLRSAADRLEPPLPGRPDRLAVLRVAADAPPRAVVLVPSAISIASFGQR
jgi:hypothetical protein